MNKNASEYDKLLKIALFDGGYGDINKCDRLIRCFIFPGHNFVKVLFLFGQLMYKYMYVLEAINNK